MNTNYADRRERFSVTEKITHVQNSFCKDEQEGRIAVSVALDGVVLHILNGADALQKANELVDFIAKSNAPLETAHRTCVADGAVKNRKQIAEKQCELFDIQMLK